MSHLALYGNVGLRRAYCPACERYALVIDGVRQCCDRREAGEVSAAVRMSLPHDARRLPAPSVLRAILDAQGHACFYCDRRFGSFVNYKGKVRRLRHVWDHVVPFAFGQDNREVNFVAACAPCNGWKADYVFRDAEEARAFLARRWAEMEAEYAPASHEAPFVPAPRVRAAAKARRERKRRAVARRSPDRPPLAPRRTRAAKPAPAEPPPVAACEAPQRVACAGCGAELLTRFPTVPAFCDVACRNRFSFEVTA